MTCISERASSNSTPSGLSSPALSTVSDTRKKRSRSISIERAAQDAKRLHEEDKFENLLSQITQPCSEEQSFCSFLQSRLEKLEKGCYMRITHTIMQKVMKIELEQSENRYNNIIN